jgi:hypothetical protein
MAASGHALEAFYCSGVSVRANPGQIPNAAELKFLHRVRRAQSVTSKGLSPFLRRVAGRDERPIQHEHPQPHALARE